MRRRPSLLRDGGRRDARQVQGWLHGQWKTDPRTTSSVYATARDAVWPWANPKIAATADGCDVTLGWLLDKSNTLYLCAPLGDDRLGLVFATLLQDIVEQAFDRANRQGPLDDRLLVLIDETANTPLARLPQWASTVTGAGIQLVTVWQSKAQIDQIYRGHADTVLTNHRTKLIYPSGLTDLATINYISELVGDEHVRGELEGPGLQGRATLTLAAPPTATTTSFLPAHVLRRIKPGDALMLHGNHPAVWMSGRATRPKRPRSARSQR